MEPQRGAHASWCPFVPVGPLPDYRSGVTAQIRHDALWARPLLSNRKSRTLLIYSVTWCKFLGTLGTNVYQKMESFLGCCKLWDKSMHLTYFSAMLVCYYNTFTFYYILHHCWTFSCGRLISFVVLEDQSRIWRDGRRRKAAQSQTFFMA